MMGRVTHVRVPDHDGLPSPASCDATYDFDHKDVDTQGYAKLHAEHPRRRCCSFHWHRCLWTILFVATLVMSAVALAEHLHPHDSYGGPATSTVQALIGGLFNSATQLLPPPTPPSWSHPMQPPLPPLLPKRPYLTPLSPPPPPLRSSHLPISPASAPPPLLPAVPPPPLVSPVLASPHMLPSIWSSATAEVLNSYFRAGTPSNSISRIGLVIHQFDSFEARGLPYQPCSSRGGPGPSCGSRGGPREVPDRISAMAIFRGMQRRGN